jgi:hypothetical protein
MTARPVQRPKVAKSPAITQAARVHPRVVISPVAAPTRTMSQIATPNEPRVMGSYPPPRMARYMTIANGSRNAKAACERSRTDISVPVCESDVTGSVCKATSVTETTQEKIRGGLFAFFTMLALVAWVPAAHAQLPGGSAVDEYTENVPGPGGDQPGGGQDANGGDASGGGPSSGTGGDGAASTGPTVAPSASGHSSSPGGSGAHALSSAAGHGSGQRQNVVSSADGETETVGDVPATITYQPLPPAPKTAAERGNNVAGFVIALGVVALAAAGIAWYRRRYPETLVGTQRSIN